jgi:hypothetical protein
MLTHGITHPVKTGRPLFSKNMDINPQKGDKYRWKKVSMKLSDPTGREIAFKTLCGFRAKIVQRFYYQFIVPRKLLLSFSPC